MIRFNGTSKTNLRRPWRRRISNQFAVIAAIMLFASTQIGTPNAANEGFEKASDMIVQNIGSTDNIMPAGSTMISSASADKNDSGAKAGKKRKRLKLDIFLFRR